VQRAALVVSEVVVLIVSDELHDCALRQCRRLVENKTPFLDTRSQWAHAATVRLFVMTGKPLWWSEPSVLDKH